MFSLPFCSLLLEILLHHRSWPLSRRCLSTSKLSPSLMFAKDTSMNSHFSHWWLPLWNVFYTYTWVPLAVDELFPWKSIPQQSSSISPRFIGGPAGSSFLWITNKAKRIAAIHILSTFCSNRQNIYSHEVDLSAYTRCACACVRRLW